MNFIVGADISDNNGQINWPVFKNNLNFVIMKATEGNGYIDKLFGYNLAQARALSVPRGIYHFARPDLGNTPEAEAQFFINIVKGQQLLVGESLYLDYEKPIAKNNVGWALRWLQIVEEQLGIKPLFYTYQSMLQIEDWTPVVQNDNGLWIAAPTNDPANNTFVTGAWPGAAIQQWGNQLIPGAQGVIDSNVFFGSAAQFGAYGYHPQPVAPAAQQPSPPPPTPQPAQVTAAPSSILADAFKATVAKAKSFMVVGQYLQWTDAQMTAPSAGNDLVVYIKGLQDQVEVYKNKLTPVQLADSAGVTQGISTTPVKTPSPTVSGNGGGGAHPPQFQGGMPAVSSTPRQAAATPAPVTVSPQQQAALVTLWNTIRGFIRVILF